MKKQLHAATIALLGLVSLSSCDHGDKPVTEAYNDKIGTLITPFDGSDSRAVEGQYAFTYDLTEGKMDFMSSFSYDGISYKLMADAIPFVYLTYTQGTIQKFQAATFRDVNGNGQASKLDAEVATLMRYNPVSTVVFPIARQYVISFQIDGRFKAQTFGLSSFYSGETNTTYVYNDEHREFSTQKPVYHIDMNVADGKATAYIYNPVFAAEMPPSMANTCLRLRGLNIVYSSGFFRIEGANVAAEVLEGDAYTPNPRYTFNTFSMRFNPSDLRKANISFKVADTYSAHATVSASL